jgi:hypothetical protein
VVVGKTIWFESGDSGIKLAMPLDKGWERLSISRYVPSHRYVDMRVHRLTSGFESLYGKPSPGRVQ